MTELAKEVPKQESALERKGRRKLLAVLFFLVVGDLGTLLTRVIEIEDPLQYGGLMMLFVGTCLWYYLKNGDDWGEALKFTFVVLAIFVAMVWAMIGWFAIAHSLIEWLLNAANPSSRALRAGGAAIVLGSALFWGRYNCRAVYGLSEAFVGISIGVYKAIQGPDLFASISVAEFIPFLTASVYLIVRGFDNIDQGLHKPPVDPVATAALQWVREKLKI